MHSNATWHNHSQTSRNKTFCCQKIATLAQGEYHNNFSESRLHIYKTFEHMDENLKEQGASQLATNINIW